MSANKWRVTWHRIAATHGRGWQVHGPGLDPMGKRFRTHAEALAYADEQARTIEVTLPRVEYETLIIYQDDESQLEAEAYADHDLLIEDMEDNHMVVVPPEWGETIALILLALARRKGQA